MPYPGYRHGTPKAGALPTALHPDMDFAERPRSLARILRTFKKVTRQRRFQPRAFSVIPLSGRVRFPTAQAAEKLHILQFA